MAGVEPYEQMLLAEIVPALGCTEPIAVALAAAKARAVLDAPPQELVVRCSGNVIKNAMSVVVPGSGGLEGIPIAAALGVVAGDADAGLECLAHLTPADVEQAQECVAQGRIGVALAEGLAGLFIEATARGGGHDAVVTIHGEHSRFASIRRDGQVVQGEPDGACATTTDPLHPDVFSVAGILDYAEGIDLHQHAALRDVLDRQAELNLAIANEGLAGRYGAQVGRTYLELSEVRTPRVRARALAAAGSDARMGGCSMPVMINAGSGNQGVTVTVPVVVYAQELGVSRDRLRRALIISNLLALYQKACIGRLSAFCGVVTAAAASGAAIAWLTGMSREGVSRSIVTAIATTGGVVCDGAKASCASKISMAVENALSAVELAGRDLGFRAHDGIVGDDADDTIRNIGRVAADGMRGTDREILDIMLGAPHRQ